MKDDDYVEMACIYRKAAKQRDLMKSRKSAQFNEHKETIVRVVNGESGEKCLETVCGWADGWVTFIGRNLSKREKKAVQTKHV